MTDGHGFSTNYLSLTTRELSCWLQRSVAEKRFLNSKKTAMPALSFEIARESLSFRGRGRSCNAHIRYDTTVSSTIDTVAKRQI